MMPITDVRGMAEQYFAKVKAAMDAMPLHVVDTVVERLYRAYVEGRTVLVIGNGGSASTASHMACDLSKNVFGQFPGGAAPTGRFKVLALTDNVPTITAWANDTEYSRVFSEQVRTFVDAGDVVIAISGSGNSPNVVQAVQLAKRMGAYTIGFLGFGGGRLGSLVDCPLVVVSAEYGPVEDIHLMLNHLVTECLKRKIASGVA